MRTVTGRLLGRLGVPGAIRPVEINDQVTGLTIKVTVSPRFTMIKIDGRDFYFERLTGRFDGTGSGCC